MRPGPIGPGIALVAADLLGDVDDFNEAGANWPRNSSWGEQFIGADE